MSNFDEIFERIKLSTNTRTQVELAEILDIRQSSISDAKRRNSIPSDWYMKLFEKFGLSPDWLKKGLGPMYLRTEQGYEPVDGPLAGKLCEEAARYSEPDATGVVVTVHSMRCEGSDDEGWTPVSVGKVSIPKSYVRPGLLVIKMDASSMEPIIRRGAYVGIDKDQKNIVSGELYGVYVPFEGLAVKRVFLDAEKSRFLLRPEAKDHPEQYLPVEQHAGRIIGRVAWVLQEL